MEPTQEYDVYAARYARSVVSREDKYHRWADHGVEGSETLGMDFYFWVIRNAERILLVDCGFNGEQRDYPQYRHDVSPTVLLDRLGIRPEEVDHVILSHLHMDHIGNVDLFPRATFSVARAEYEFWTGPFAEVPQLSRGGISREIAAVAELVRSGRAQLLDEDQELYPGVHVQICRGHTPGQLVTSVATPRNTVVLASDASHFYEEMEWDRPFYLFVDLEGMYATYRTLRSLIETPGIVVVPGHDPQVMQRFALTAPDCIDLSRPVGDENSPG